MQMNKRNARHAAQKRPLPPAVKIVAAVLALALLVVVGIRLYTWLDQRNDSRVMVLINPWNGVDSCGFRPKLVTVEGVQVDKSCKKPLEQLLADGRAAGISITATAGYRSREEQLSQFNNEVDRQMSAGRDADSAYSLSEHRVGAPGNSEHELGLAVDFQGAEAQAWLKENAWRYGFILRYPEGSESITGRSADSAHYRYVGQAAAEQIYSLQITLEEYMGMFYTQEAEIIFN